MATKKQKPRKVARDARTGEFTTMAKAKRRPSVTTVETMPAPRKRTRA